MDLLSPTAGEWAGKEIGAARPSCVPSEGRLGLLSPATGAGKEEIVCGRGRGAPKLKPW